MFVRHSLLTVDFLRQTKVKCIKRRVYLDMKKSREYNTDENKKTQVLNARVSEAEKDKLLKIGQRLNMNQSDTIRFAIRSLIDDKDWILEKKA